MLLDTGNTYIMISRQKRDESVIVPIEAALKTIKDFDRQNKFMLALGQTTFWQKNRLDLWRALEDIAVDHGRLANCQLLSDSIVFQQTDFMLETIKMALRGAVNRRIQNRRSVDTNNWSYDPTAQQYYNGQRRDITRAKKAHVNDFWIRTQDIAAFNTELNKLLDRYAVTAPNRLTQGHQQFNYQDVGQRYVERVFGFDREAGPTKWQD